MSGRVLKMPKRRVAIEPIQFEPELWLVACACGFTAKVTSREVARATRRRHQADHRRAEEQHPAGKGQPPRGGGAA